MILFGSRSVPQEPSASSVASHGSPAPSSSAEKKVDPQTWGVVASIFQSLSQFFSKLGEKMTFPSFSGKRDNGEVASSVGGLSRELIRLEELTIARQRVSRLSLFGRKPRSFDVEKVDRKQLRELISLRLNQVSQGEKEVSLTKLVDLKEGMGEEGWKRIVKGMTATQKESGFQILEGLKRSKIESEPIVVKNKVQDVRFPSSETIQNKMNIFSNNINELLPKTIEDDEQLKKIHSMDSIFCKDDFLELFKDDEKKLISDFKTAIKESKESYTHLLVELKELKEIEDPLEKSRKLVVILEGDHLRRYLSSTATLLFLQKSVEESWKSDEFKDGFSNRMNQFKTDHRRAYRLMLDHELIQERGRKISIYPGAPFPTFFAKVNQMKNILATAKETLFTIDDSTLSNEQKGCLEEMRSSLDGSQEKLKNFLNDLNEGVKVRTLAAAFSS